MSLKIHFSVTEFSSYLQKYITQSVIFIRNYTVNAS